MKYHQMFTFFVLFLLFSFGAILVQAAKHKYDLKLDVSDQFVNDCYTFVFSQGLINPYNINPINSRFCLKIDCGIILGNKFLFLKMIYEYYLFFIL
ncbi:MAG: hypothetical protein C4527_16105 [Candidatus Omnitrophota bacterium]|nr:MAG: hypothetical protein C4527_16105 [Candidatus Omnitrophota bacterium]